MVIPLWRKLDQMHLPHTSNSSPSQMAVTPPKSKIPPNQDSTTPPSRLPLPCSPGSSSTARQSNHSSMEPNISWVMLGMSAANSVQQKTNTQLPHSQAHTLTHPPQTHTLTQPPQTHTLSSSVTDSRRNRSPGREEVNRLFGYERRYD